MLGFKTSLSFVVGLLGLILIAHGLATVSDAYFYYWWLDIVMHFAGGLWAGALAIYFFPKKDLSSFTTFWLILGLVMIIGVVWELVEFIGTNFLTGWGREIFFQPSLEDTLGDLMADLIGGFAAVFLFKITRETV